MAGRSRVTSLLVAEGVSGFGSQMAALALPWFVLVTTGSSARMGMVTAAELLPLAVLGIPSGSLIDRLGARTTMVVSDALRAPASALIPLLSHSGRLTFPLLLVIAVVLGALSSPYFAAQRLVLPAIVGDDERVLGQANSVLESVQRLTLLVGPAVAGLRFLLRDRFLRSLVAGVVAFGFLFQALFVSLPVLAFEQYDGSPGTAGLFFSAWGAGAFGGTLAAIRLTSRVDPLKLLTVAVLAGMSPFWLLAVPLPRVAVAGVLAFGAFFSPIGNAPMFALLTSHPPVPLRAKVVTAALTLNAVGAPLAGVVAGQALSRVGTYPVLLAIAVGLNLTAVGFARAVLRERRTAVVGAARVG